MAGRLSLIPAVGYLESLALAGKRSGRDHRLRRAATRGLLVWDSLYHGARRNRMDGDSGLRRQRPGPPEQAPDRLAMTLSDQLSRWGSGKTWDRTSYGDGTAAQRIAKAVNDLIEQR